MSASYALARARELQASGMECFPARCQAARENDVSVGDINRAYHADRRERAEAGARQVLAAQQAVNSRPQQLELFGRGMPS